MPAGAVREESRVAATGLNRDCSTVWPAQGVSETAREREEERRFVGEKKNSKR